MCPFVPRLAHRAQSRIPFVPDSKKIPTVKTVKHFNLEWYYSCWFSLPVRQNWRPVCHLPNRKWIVRPYLNQSWKAYHLRQSWQKDCPGVCVCVCTCTSACALCVLRSPLSLLTAIQAGRPPGDPEPFENMIVILVGIWPGCLLPV